MLRITRIPSGERGGTLRLEGKLLEPWIAEVTAATQESATEDAGVRLDLSGVSFIDRAGLRLLYGLMEEGVEIASGSGYVAELLRVEDRS